MNTVVPFSPAPAVGLLLKLESAGDGQVRVAAAAGIRYDTAQLILYDYGHRVIDRIDLTAEKVTHILQVRGSIAARALGSAKPQPD